MLLWKHRGDWFHFTNEEMVTQKVPCPRLQKYYEVELGLKPKPKAVLFSVVFDHPT